MFLEFTVSAENASSESVISVSAKTFLSITIPYLSVAHIDARVSDAEEDVLRRGPHERDVVVIEGVSRVQVFLVAPHKVVELVDVDEAAGWLVRDQITKHGGNPLTLGNPIKWNCGKAAINATIVGFYLYSIRIQNGLK